MLLEALCAAQIAGAPMAAPELVAFRRDLEYSAYRIMTVHPAPFARSDRQAFLEDIAWLNTNAWKESLGCAGAQLMKVIADLHDGHTNFNVINAEGFRSWYPLRLYWLNGGLFVMSTLGEHRGLIGGRVVSFGNTSVSDALERVRQIYSSDNEYATYEGAMWLSNATIACALGVGDGEKISVTVERPDGRKITQTIQALHTMVRDNWMGHGEMFGPRFPDDQPSYVTAFGDRSPLDYRKHDDSLPLHLRYRNPYSMIPLPEHKAVYFQFNFTQNSTVKEDGTFVEFTRSLLATLDLHPDWRLIIDIRYNSGGDGDLLPPFVRQLAQRDRFTKPGSLFVLTGPKTFSAAIMLIGELKRNTSAIFVGEPTRAGLNHFGDANGYDTPGLGARLYVSTLYHQLSRWDDKYREFDPQIPILMDSKSYFEGKDPALEYVLRGQHVLPVSDVAAQSGGNAAQVEFDWQIRNWGHISWWRPFFNDREMNSVANDMLERGQISDALIGVRINAQAYPDDWFVWQNKGEAEVAAGDLSSAVASYQRSLQIFPENTSAKAALREIEQRK
jgi:hypothetical protein